MQWYSVFNFWYCLLVSSLYIFSVLLEVYQFINFFEELPFCFIDFLYFPIFNFIYFYSYIHYFLSYFGIIFILWLFALLFLCFVVT